MISELPYCADLTELNAGDSWLRQQNGEARDPRAQQVFEDLVSTLCNKNTVLYFEKPQYFPEYPTLLMGLWDEIYAKQRQNGIAPGPNLEKAAPLDKAERWAVMSREFDWIIENQPDAVHDLVAFTQFQMSSEGIMELFWGSEARPNNTADKLLEALSHMSVASSSKLSCALAVQRIPLGDVSRQRIRAAGMTAQQAAVAWSFWVFVKGFRYAMKMPERHVHLVHWLRERAVAAGITTANEKQEQNSQVNRLFPWGAAIGALLDKGIIPADQGRLRELITAIRTMDEPLAGYTDFAGDEESCNTRIAEAVMDVSHSVTAALDKALGATESSKFSAKDIVVPLVAAALAYATPADVSKEAKMLLTLAAALAGRTVVTAAHVALPRHWLCETSVPVLRNIHIWKARRALLRALKDPQFVVAAQRYVLAKNSGRIQG